MAAARLHNKLSDEVTTRPTCEKLAGGMMLTSAQDQNWYLLPHSLACLTRRMEQSRHSRSAGRLTL